MTAPLELYEIEELLEEIAGDGGNSAHGLGNIEDIGWGPVGENGRGDREPVLIYDDYPAEPIELEDADLRWLDDLENTAQPAPTMNKPPSKCTASFLLKEVVKDLKFAEWAVVEATLRGVNLDLFGCLPANDDVYEKCPWLSPRPDDIMLLLSRAHSQQGYQPNLLSAPPGLEFPGIPAFSDGIPGYIEAVTRYFEALLAHREREYMGLFSVYCRLLAQHTLISASAPTGGLRSKQRSDKEIKDRFVKLLREGYYRGAESILLILRAHMIITTAREVSYELWHQQRGATATLATITFRWDNLQQFQCVFNPLLFAMGPVFLENSPLPLRQLQDVNYVRNRLNLPLLRCGLLEASPSAMVPEFDRNALTSFDFLQLSVRACMMSYSRANPLVPALRDHEYARDPDAPNYATTRASLIAGCNESAEYGSTGCSSPDLTPGKRKASSFSRDAALADPAGEPVGHKTREVSKRRPTSRSPRKSQPAQLAPKTDRGRSPRPTAKGPLIAQGGDVQNTPTQSPSPSPNPGRRAGARASAPCTGTLVLPPYSIPALQAGMPGAVDSSAVPIEATMSNIQFLLNLN